MKATFKTILYFLGLVALLIAGYVGYLALTYIDDTVFEGEAYGFEIGTKKLQTFSDIKPILIEHPQLSLYISYGQRAGDNMTLDPVDNSFSEAAKYDSWWLLLDGKSEFFNIIRLRFDNERLVEIHRHRQYFELP